MQIKKRKEISAKMPVENPQATTSGGGMPPSIKASLSSLKVKDVSSTTGGIGGELPKAKSTGDMGIALPKAKAMEDEPEEVHNAREEYKERLKKRAK